MFKNLYVAADSNLINFNLRSKLSQRITRNGSDVHILKIVEEQPWDKKLRNSIPTDIRNSNTIVTFKSLNTS